MRSVAGFLLFLSLEMSSFAFYRNPSIDAFKVGIIYLALFEDVSQSYCQICECENIYAFLCKNCSYDFFKGSNRYLIFDLLMYVSIP